MKLLIIGYGRHGKDTVAELFNKNIGLTFQSSSAVATKHIIYPEMKSEYKNEEECFNDRHNNRDKWYNLISKYNSKDSSRLTKKILQEYDIYVGMRSKIELDASKHLFDIIIWVDASKRLPKESSSSCTISISDADIIIDNNGDYKSLVEKINRLCKLYKL